MSNQTMRRSIGRVGWFTWIGLLVLIAWHWHTGFWPVFLSVFVTLCYNAVYQALSDEAAAQRMPEQPKRDSIFDVISESAKHGGYGKRPDNPAKPYPPRPATRYDEPRGYQPNVPDVDWMQTRPTAGTGAQAPKETR